MVPLVVCLPPVFDAIQSSWSTSLCKTQDLLLFLAQHQQHKHQLTNVKANISYQMLQVSLANVIKNCNVTEHQTQRWLMLLEANVFKCYMSLLYYINLRLSEPASNSGGQTYFIPLSFVVTFLKLGFCRKSTAHHFTKLLEITVKSTSR